VNTVNGAFNIMAKGLEGLGKDPDRLYDKVVRKASADRIEACSEPVIVSIGLQ
jgi:hypothetical protein